jgi:hypothetical protein
MKWSIIVARIYIFVLWEGGLYMVWFPRAFIWLRTNGMTNACLKLYGSQRAGTSEGLGRMERRGERGKIRLDGAPLIAAWGGGDGGRGLKPGAQSGRRCSDSGADRRAPRGLIIFQIFQNLFKLVKSKWVPYSATKIPKFCMRLDWSIMNIYIDCAYFKFPTESMVNILEQIQYLNLL